MSTIKIKIQSLEDVRKDEPLLEGATTDNVTQLTDVTACILQGGMKSGGTSMMIVLKDPKTGHRYVGEISAENFKGVHSALIGAETRWNKES